MDRDAFVSGLVGEIRRLRERQEEGKGCIRTPQEILRELCDFDFVRPSPSEARLLSTALVDFCSAKPKEGPVEGAEGDDNGQNRLEELRITRKLLENLDYMTQRGDSCEHAATGDGENSALSAYAELSGVCLLTAVRYTLQLNRRELGRVLGEYGGLRWATAIASGGPGDEFSQIAQINEYHDDFNDLVEATSLDDDDFVYEGCEASEPVNEPSRTNLYVMAEDVAILQRRMSDVIKSINASKFAAISPLRWREMGMSGEAREIMHLLGLGGSSSSSLLEKDSNENEDSINSLRRSWPVLAFLLRDRITQNGSESDDCVAPLLSLLQNQIQVATCKKPEISEASVVGLQILSFLSAHFQRSSVKASTQGIDACNASSMQEWLRPSLPALAACLDALIAEGRGAMGKHFDSVTASAVEILTFYTGVCRDLSAPVNIGSGLCENGIHRLLLQLVLIHASESAEGLLLWIAAQSSLVASYVASAPAALKYFSSDAFVKKKPIAALAWATLVHAAGAECEEMLAPLELSTKLMENALNAVRVGRIEPSAILRGLRPLECAKFRLLFWMKSSEVWQKIMDTLEICVATCLAAGPSGISEDGPSAADGDENKLARRMKDYQGDVALMRRSLKVLKHLEISKGD